MANFEEQLSELEKVVDQLERGDLPLEDSVALFERGVRLSNACKGQLAAAESRIQVLLEPERDGPVKLGDLDLPAEEADDEDDEISLDEEDDGRL